MSDAQVMEAAAERLGVPRADRADSFVLHAPLELMARCRLLAHADTGSRESIRRAMTDIADAFDAWGPPIIPAISVAGAAIPNVDDALCRALDDGDLDAADQAIVQFISRCTSTELVAALAGPILPSLAAAAHGAIFLQQLSLVPSHTRAISLMSRSLVRELAREPGWRVEWIDEDQTGERSGGSLMGVLLGPPSPGDPGSPFIYPTMSLVDRSGLAAELLAAPTRNMSVAEARRQLLRVAALSMLQDDMSSAPYGWSHCLTMPQAVLSVAQVCGGDPRRAIAVAATYVLGFRATLGRVVLDPSWAPARPASVTSPAGLLADGPSTAAAAMWHADPDVRPALVRRMVSHAAAHHDAHLAKYVMACLDAAADDPDAAPLFLAAGAFLSGWWHQRDVDVSDGGSEESVDAVPHPEARVRTSVAARSVGRR